METKDKIVDILDGMKDLLIYKNEQYGDSALNPVCIFTKHIKTVDSSTALILTRTDDKLSRVKNAEQLRINDISDIIGYLTLLLIKLGASSQDIEKMKD